MFKIGVLKHFNHGQTIVNILNIFDFDTPKHRQYFEFFNFDEFDHIYGLICVFTKPKVLDWLLLPNR